MHGAWTLTLDATDAAHPEPTGIGVYSQKLIAALAGVAAQQEPPSRILLCFRPGPYLRWAWRRQWPVAFSVVPLLDPWLHYPSATLVHGLSLRLPQRSYPVQVATLHDRYPAVSADYSPPDFQLLMTRRTEHALRRADRIIAVSHYVRQRLLEYAPSLEGKVRVVHHGVDSPQPASQAELEAFRERVLGFATAERFFLNVGAIQVRKNIAHVALALKQLPQFRLVLAGGDGYGAEQIRDLIRKEGLRDRVRILGHMPHDQLRFLYPAATALVFPSLEEPFGLPILEAMSYGLPVITSNCSAMPEVGGAAARYVDPHSVSEIAEAMRRIAEDESLASDLSQRGRQRARQFRWEDCAARTWNIYLEALREHT